METNDKPLHTIIALDLAVTTLGETLRDHQPILARAWAAALQNAASRAPEFVPEGVQECLILWAAHLTRRPNASAPTTRP